MNLSKFFEQISIIWDFKCMKQGKSSVHKQKLITSIHNYTSLWMRYGIITKFHWRRNIKIIKFRGRRNKLDYAHRNNRCFAIGSIQIPANAAERWDRSRIRRLYIEYIVIREIRYILYERKEWCCEIGDTAFYYNCFLPILQILYE